MKRIYILTMVLACALLSSCTSTKVDEAFLSTASSGLSIKGNDIFRFDALSCQTSFNREKREFRVFTDNMSDYYCLTLNSVPSQVGDKAKGELRWTSRNGVETKRDLSFQVEQTGRSGRMWLWCKKEAIGVVVQTNY